MKLKKESTSYDVLLKPLEVGNVLLKNRVFVAAHTYGFFDAQRIPTDKMFHYVLERAKGGAALIILGETSVSYKPGGRPDRWESFVSRDESVAFYRNLSDAVQPYGMKIFEQLYHPGGQVWVDPGAIAYAPSSVPHPISSLVPAEMPLKMIEEYIEDFGIAARRVQDGGLDGIELKLDQGKLHHQFLSPYFNRRNDAYGGSFDKRMRFVLETLECIRKYVGSNIVVGVRLTGDTFPDPDAPIKDLSLDDSLLIAKRLSESGYIDFINVNGATNSNLNGYWISHGDSTIERANFAPLAQAIKVETNLPIFVASQIIHPIDAVKVITSGSADMVAMTRAHIADPHIIVKVIGNRVDDIRPCVSCNQSCVGNTWVGKEVRCIHNPITGNEMELSEDKLSKVSTPKKIVIVGGGPAGLEAARVAAVRGHQVILFERSNQLGGQVRIAAKAPYRHRLNDIVDYLSLQLSKLPNVEVRLGCEVSAKDVIAVSPDNVIISTGAKPMLPDIPNINSFNAFTIDQGLEHDVFRAGNHVVVVDEDWRLHALSLVNKLTLQGIQVTIITSKEFAGKGLDIVNIASYYKRLLESNIAILPWTEVIDFSPNSVITRNTITLKKKALSSVDGIIFASNWMPNNSIASELLDGGIQATSIGDCVFARGIEFAIYEGHMVGREV